MDNDLVVAHDRSDESSNINDDTAGILHVSRDEVEMFCV